MRLNHNLASLNIFKEQSRVLQKQSSSLERVSSGYKVNKTKDNPDALAQSERLRLLIRGTQMASKNVQDGVSMLQTAEGGLSGINEMLMRIRELTVQAGNSTNNPEDRAIIKTELDEMLKGIDNIANNTEFNGVKLLANEKTKDNKVPSVVSMPTGANVGENIDIPMYNVTKSMLIDSINLDNSDDVNNALESIDEAINTVLSISSKYGALENRFESSYMNLNEISDKMQASESSIRDADIAEEMIELSKSNILIEAGNAMMAQSNKFPQDILRILENMK